jgi:hypothetical protein
MRRGRPRLKNAKKRAQRQDCNRAIVEPEDGQDYAIVESMLGNGRLSTLTERADARCAHPRINAQSRRQGHH